MKVIEVIITELDFDATAVKNIVEKMKTDRASS